MAADAGSDTPEVRLGKPGERVKLLSLDDLDRRRNSYRKAMSLIAALEADAGGREALSVGQRQLVQRAAVHGAMIEDFETRWLAGQEVDPSTYCMLTNSQRRLLEGIGLRRQPKPLNQIDQEALAIYETELQS